MKIQIFCPYQLNHSQLAHRPHLVAPYSPFPYFIRYTQSLKIPQVICFRNKFTEGQITIHTGKRKLGRLEINNRHSNSSDGSERCLVFLRVSFQSQKFVGMCQKILSKCNEVLSWLEANQLAEKDEFDHKRKELEQVCNPIITKLYQGGCTGPSCGTGYTPGRAATGPTIEEVD